MKEWESEKNKLVNIVEITNNTIRQKDKELEELRNQVCKFIKLCCCVLWWKKYGFEQIPEAVLKPKILGMSKQKLLFKLWNYYPLIRLQ